jgi:hypothetical protein
MAVMYISQKTLIALLPFLLPATTWAANDWKVPCTSGVCSWDTGNGVDTAWSTIHISGTNTAISDVTNAAGWQILDCDAKSANPQDIRLVCTDPKAGCDSLFKGGAEDTIVRLPNSCGAGPFARVTKAWVHEDQSVPSSVAKKMKRAVADPKHPVRGLALTYDFDGISDKNGPVSFWVSSTTNPLQRGHLDTLQRRDHISVRHGNPRLQARGIFDGFTDKLKQAGDAIKNAGQKVVDGVTGATDKAKEAADKAAAAAKEAADKAAQAAKDAAAKAGDAAKKVADGAKDALGDANDFDKNFNTDLPPIKFEKLGIPVVDLALDCPIGPVGVATGLKITADANVDAKVSVGMLAKGTIVPPKLDDIAVTGSVTSGASMKFLINANAQGNFQTPLIPIFTAGIPGLDIPGIVQLGPTITINTKVDADINALADMDLTATVNIDKLSLSFPPEKGPSSATVNPGKSLLQVAKLGGDAGINGNVKSNAVVHLIPRLEVGVNAFAGKAKAVVFLAADGAATMDLDTLGTAQSDGTKSIGGCMNLGLGVDISAGAEGSVLSLIKGGKNFDLFNKKADVFTKCFGDQVGKEDSFRQTKTVSKRGLLDNIKPFSPQLKCPGATPTVVEPAISQDVESPAS